MYRGQNCNALPSANSCLVIDRAVELIRNRRAPPHRPCHPRRPRRPSSIRRRPWTCRPQYHALQTMMNHDGYRPRPQSQQSATDIVICDGQCRPPAKPIVHGNRRHDHHHSHQSRLSSTSDQRPSSPAMIHAIFSKVPQAMVQGRLPGLLQEISFSIPKLGS